MLQYDCDKCKELKREILRMKKEMIELKSKVEILELDKDERDLN